MFLFLFSKVIFIIAVILLIIFVDNDIKVVVTVMKGVVVVIFLKLNVIDNHFSLIQIGQKSADSSAYKTMHSRV